MLDLLLGAIVSLGVSGIQNVLVLEGERILKKLKESHKWKRLICGTGEFFVKNSQEADSFYEDLKLVLSKENLSKIAKSLKDEDGYNLKNKLQNSFMQLMSKYEIPYEVAELYTTRIMYVILEELREIDSEKYERYFLREWKDEQGKLNLKLQDRIDKTFNDLATYNREQVAVTSSGELDISLRRSTYCPSIGIAFFSIDDESFQDKFDDLRYDELIFIRGRSREETIFCVINELWRLNDRRPIYIVNDLPSWEKLQSMGGQDNIYIPWFYAEEIVAIGNNSNIFVIDEDNPLFGKKVLELRPRTRKTLLKCLEEAGLGYSEAYSLLSDTHGLYSQIKKKIFKGEYLRKPVWMIGISERAQKTCLLIGGWEENEGDKLVIETLYEDSYDKFIEEVLPYAKGEDPLIYRIESKGSFSYRLVSNENIWSYLTVSTDEKIWGLFVTILFEVLNEAENLFTYDYKERILAQIKGEKLFWSETIRRGMLKTLLIKGVYQADEETEKFLNNLVRDILEPVRTEQQWLYISKFWKELCEISPISVIHKIENEWNENTGLLSLFQNQSQDFLFGGNSYIDILWGIEQLLSQKDFFWPAFRWLLKLDSKKYDYKSNNPKDIFKKIFCTWMNCSPLETSEEKIKAAEVAFEWDYDNAWNHLISALDSSTKSIWGGLSVPKYREHCNFRSTTIYEMQNTQNGYLELLLKHMDFLVERWKKLLELSSNLTDEFRRKFFKKLSDEVRQMTDEEIIEIKNEIRDFIFRHRYFATSEWSLSEDNIVEYEKFLDTIHISTVEYEYGYLFQDNYTYPLLHPCPYDKEGARSKNKILKERLIKEKLLEFQAMKYNLSILAKICSKRKYSTLGNYLAKYWNDGRWDYTVFICLLRVQPSGRLALAYLEGFNSEKDMEYNLLIEDLISNGYSIEVLASVYRIEACRTKKVPLVTNTSKEIKKEFWKNCIYFDNCNVSWVITECKKYSTLEVYLAQIHLLYDRNLLTPENILDCFEGIEKMDCSQVNSMMSYHVEHLLSEIQNAYIDNLEKCNQISKIEIFFSSLLDWDNMKCFQLRIKKSPEIFAQLVEGTLRKDPKLTDTNKQYHMYLYEIYEKAHFCPAEMNGRVDEINLEEWIKEYKNLLIENNQESFFSPTLGRLFSFSPIGDDGYEPCESVRKMIEKYGDEKMINSYQIEVFNRRGIYNFTAGKEEFKIAEEFKKTAEYLEPCYPKTAKIFNKLYKQYKRESERERVNAENNLY